jgi:hypothetical protein
VEADRAFGGRGGEVRGNVTDRQAHRESPFKRSGAAA